MKDSLSDAAWYDSYSVVTSVPRVICSRYDPPGCRSIQAERSYAFFRECTRANGPAAQQLQGRCHLCPCQGEGGVGTVLAMRVSLPRRCRRTSFDRISCTVPVPVLVLRVMDTTAFGCLVPCVLHRHPARRSRGPAMHLDNRVCPENPECQTSMSIVDC